MAAYSGGNAEDPGITCTVAARFEFGDFRISSYTCSNGTSFTNLAHKEGGVWTVDHTIGDTAPE